MTSLKKKGTLMVYHWPMRAIKVQN